MRDAFPQLLQSERFYLVKGDGWEQVPDQVDERAGPPFDAIHVGAAASEIPASLMDQLAVGGRMVIPVKSKNGLVNVEGVGPVLLKEYQCGCEGQLLVAVDRDANGELDYKAISEVIFVPLVKQRDRHRQHSH